MRFSQSQRRPAHNVGFDKAGEETRLGVANFPLANILHDARDFAGDMKAIRLICTPVVARARGVELFSLMHDSCEIDPFLACRIRRICFRLCLPPIQYAFVADH